MAKVELYHRNGKWHWSVVTPICIYMGKQYTRWGAKRAIKRVLKWI